MVKIAAAAALLSLASCSTYKGGGQKYQTLGTDSNTSLSIHYVSGQDQSASFTQAIETITAAVISTATAATATRTFTEAIKR